jgi:hypothetical protein
MNFRPEFSGLLIEVLETWAALLGLLSVEKSWGTRNIAILVDQSPHSGEARDLERSGDPITEIPCQSTPRTKAHKKIGKNHPSLQQNTMGRADKSALVTKAVLAIRRGEFQDYSNAVKKFHCSHTAVMRRIKGQIKT